MKGAIIKKIKFLTIIFVLLGSFLTAEQPQFEKYFVDTTLRIDYNIIGNSETETIILDKLSKTGIWSGNPDRLLDKFNNGEYYYQVYDALTNEIIYSRGFDNYFREYQTTKPAAEGQKKVFQETALIPLPKNPVIFVVARRDDNNILKPIFEKQIDPADYHIIDQQIPDNYLYKVHVSGDPHKKVDLLFIGDGYTDKEKRAFKKDLDRYVEYLFDTEPFGKNSEKFNIYGIMPESMERGVDQPRRKDYKKTAIEATFNSLESPRYLLTENIWELHDIASQTPYDAICIMVNSERYGGGGIYNYYCTFTADNDRSDFTFLHELGHSFGGLADEYYSSSVAYSNFYPKDIEPTEPNITALIDPNRLKWKDQLSEGIEIPTDWNKAEYDSMSILLSELRSERNHELSRLKQNQASQEKIDSVRNDYKTRINRLDKKLKDFILNHPLKDKIGVFEGAGYESEGIYRPTVNSIMKEFIGDRAFNKVCEKALSEIIEHYTE